jgi:hypothetical protein
MNDDPTQLFPETHWKRYATERVSTTTQKAEGAVFVGALHSEMRKAAAPGVEVKVATPAAVPSLN